MLTFSAQHPDANPLKARKNDPENLFSEAVEVALEFEEVTEPESKTDGLFKRVLMPSARARTKPSRTTPSSPS